MRKIPFSKNDPIRIVLFRVDKIGDVVLSLQCAEALKKTYPNAYISFVLQSYTAPLAENNPFIDEIILVDAYNQKTLTNIIKDKKFDVSICFKFHKVECYVPFLAGIKIRIGRLAVFRTLLFTHKILNHKTNAKKHEAEYNLDLLKPLGCNIKCFPKLYLTNKEKQKGKEFIQASFPNNTLPVIILHPGSFKSAIDWPKENYFLLAEYILKNNIAEVLISGSSAELDDYKTFIKNYPLLKTNNLFSKQLALREFLGVIANANLLISNSTGPLHCARALEIKTIGFYPLIKVHSPARWGVFSEHKEKHISITPKKENYDKTVM